MNSNLRRCTAGKALGRLRTRAAAMSATRRVAIATAALVGISLVVVPVVASAAPDAGQSVASAQRIAAAASASASASPAATPSPSPSPSPPPSTSPSTSCANPIVCENQLPGTPQSVWDVSASEGTTIQGFADPFSVNVGESVSFKIKTSASAYKIDIYRMGYYGGDGARLITSLSPNVSVSQQQPTCSTNTSTGLVDCGNWAVSATWAVPAAAVSGVYFAHIYSSTDENQIPFVVTNDASTSDVVFATSDETWQAYNDWGGYNVYSGSATGSPWCCSQLDPGRAVQVSYNRPFATRFDTPSGQDFFFYVEFPMIQYLEENGYDVTYVSQSDIAAPGGAALIEQHKIFTMSGHSEYFDAGDRTSITTARNAGVNLAFFSGNLMWWKTRWAASQYGNEAYRTLITYKESLDSTQSDPADPPTWTGAWRDPRFASSGDDSGQPENSLTGQLWMVNCCSYADQVSYQYAKDLIWRNTAVASLQPGQTYSMPAETLGYEWDSDIDNGHRPAGEIDMSKTCENVSQLLLTVNEEIGTGNACNSLTLYRAASGALVFDAGTVQWAWGLYSGNHDGDNNGADRAMQQATVNLFAMMNVQPATLMSGLVAGVAPHDTAPPTSVITAPAAGSAVASGSTVTVSGTAADAGGGVVAGVEVSTDGGATWHPVTTMSSDAASVQWTYTWSAAGLGAVSILSRATDDDANTENPGPGVSVTVSCPCGLFGNNYVPAATSTADPTAYELGMKFESTVPGWIAGVRFYKGSGNNGTHTGSLWSTSGALLASGTFTGESASGWQTLLFANPVQVSANTLYVVSYYDPDGNYASEQDKFDTPLSTAPLIAPSSNYLTAGAGNGVFLVGGHGFPTQSYAGTSYGVDVVFDTTQPPGAPPAVTAVTPAPGSSSNPVSDPVTATFTKPVTGGTAAFSVKDPSGVAVAGSVSLDSTGTVATFTPTNSLAAGTTYSVTVSGAQDSFGQTMSQPLTFSFTTSQSFPASCPCAIWPDVAPQGASDAADSSSVELGVTFTPSLNGVITGVRFYKEPDNTGTHTGELWSSSGTELATGTFTSEPTEGWSELTFSQPVSVTAGQTYVASYHTSTGHYADTPGGLSSAVTTGPLTAAASGGVYAYGSSVTFPENSYNAANYWVDVVFANPAEPPPAVTTTMPSAGATSVPVSASTVMNLSQQILPGSAAFTLTGPGSSSVSGTLSLNASGTRLTFSPAAALTAGAQYTATLSGATNVFGVAMSSPYTWTFTTAGVPACPCSIFESDSAPTIASAADPGPVNLGVAFTSDTSGWITGVKFYKGAANTGTHVGSLWTAAGTLLAQVTFSNETSTGWQTAYFATPVAITAGTTYIASYYAPNGGYSADPGTFTASATDNSPLHALSVSGYSNGNGLYIYGGSPEFPTYSYNATNYWVDVVFTTT